MVVGVWRLLKEITTFSLSDSGQLYSYTILDEIVMRWLCDRSEVVGGIIALRQVPLACRGQTSITSTEGRRQCRRIVGQRRSGRRRLATAAGERQLSPNEGAIHT